MIEDLLALPPHIRARLASALDSGMVAKPYSTAMLRMALGDSGDTDRAFAVLSELDRLGITEAAAAAWIRTIEDAISGTPKPNLVWTGPEVPGLHARDTRRVYQELLGTAKISLWISTYAYFDGPKAFETLAKRIDEVPDLRVTLLLNIHRRWGDTTDANALVRKFADRFWSVDWPGSIRPTVYYDPRSLELEGPGAVLHAKAVIVDEEALFVTSANLTEAALERNIELGLLVRDRALAKTATRYFRILIDRGLLSPLPLA